MQRAFRIGPTVFPLDRLPLSPPFRTAPPHSSAVAISFQFPTLDRGILWLRRTARHSSKLSSQTISTELTGINRSYRFICANQAYSALTTNWRKSARNAKYIPRTPLAWPFVATTGLTIPFPMPFPFALPFSLITPLPLPFAWPLSGAVPFPLVCPLPLVTLAVSVSSLPIGMLLFWWDFGVARARLAPPNRRSCELSPARRGASKFYKWKKTKTRERNKK